MENELGTRIIGAAIEVHRELGPGLLESAYEGALAAELRGVGLTLETQVPVDVVYKGQDLGLGFRADLIVERQVLIELKSVEKIMEVHKKQVQTYLKLTGLKLGYLMNFNSTALRSGIVRCVNGLSE